MQSNSPQQYDTAIGAENLTETQKKLLEGVKRVTDIVDLEFIGSNANRRDTVMKNGKELMYRVIDEEDRRMVVHQITAQNGKVVVTRSYDLSKDMQLVITDIDSTSGDQTIGYQLTTDGRLSVTTPTSDGKFAQKGATEKDMIGLSMVINSLTAGLEVPEDLE